MHTLKPAFKAIARVLLIVVFLLNTFTPAAQVVQAAPKTQESANHSFQKTNQESRPYPVFERPEPRLGNRNSNPSPEVPSASEDTKQPTQVQESGMDQKLKAAKVDMDQKLKTAKEKIAALKLIPNPVRKIIPSSKSPADVQGKDTFIQDPETKEKIYTVTTLDDHDDGVCNLDCSLREAIYASNDSPGADIINFGVSGLVQIKSVLPHILDKAGLTIDGTGRNVIITENNSASVDGNGSGVSSTLNPMTVLDADPEECIFINNDVGPLDLPSGWYSNCIVYSKGPLSIHGSFFTDNSTIYSESTMTIADSTVADSPNIYAQDSITSSNSSFSNISNFYSEGSFDITAGTYLNNSPIYSQSTMTIADSTVADSPNIYAQDSITSTNSSFSDIDNFYSPGTFDFTTSTVSNSPNVYAEISMTSTNSSFSDIDNFYSQGAFDFTTGTILRSKVYSEGDMHISSDDAMTIANSTLISNPATKLTTGGSTTFYGDTPVSGNLETISNSSVIGSSLQSEGELTITSVGPLTSTNSTFSGSNVNSNTNLYLYNTILANNSICGRPASGHNNLIEANLGTA